MEADKHNIKKLFQKDVRYFIPTFQRPYVWNQEKQWEPLWNDVRNLAEEYAEKLAEENGNQANAEAGVGTHFLGAIVLQQEPTPVESHYGQN
ncbi:MAG: DUF262 domain-containing protein [Candidatus Promineofilum sp.]|nr:DUF262 domain-containing protein [Promineifilum sp.]